MARVGTRARRRTHTAFFMQINMFLLRGCGIYENSYVLKSSDGALGRTTNLHGLLHISLHSLKLGWGLYIKLNVFV